jgi:hypothetical protein
MDMRFPKWLVPALALTTLPADVAAQDARAEVLVVLDVFFDGLRTKDAAKMATVIEPYTRLTLLRPSPTGGSQVMVMTAADFNARVTAAGQPALDEVIRDPEVRIDGDLATVWTRYQVRINGAVSHCGTDAFHLARISNRWKIVNVSDTFTQEGCGEPWA